MIMGEADILSDLRVEADDVVRQSDSKLGLTEETAERVDRLAGRLFPMMSVPGSCTLSFGEVGFGSRGSALWLTAAVARVLADRLSAPVHVLSTGAPLHKLTSRYHRDSTDECALEYLALNRKPGSISALTLKRRLAELTASKRKVLLHLPDVQGCINPLGGMGLQGIVLLARAGHTRKAALTALQIRLEQLELPLIGAVLLERTYPIPEALYRLL